MEISHLSFYLSLFHADWLSPIQFSRLIQKFGSLHCVLAANDDEILQLGFNQSETDQIRCSASETCSAVVDNDLTWNNAEDQTILCYPVEGCCIKKG